MSELSARPAAPAVLAAGMVTFGALTLVAAGKRALEGEAAFGLFLLITGPIALVALHLWFRKREPVIARATPAFALLFALTMAVGAATGSTFAADAALGAAMTAGGLALRIPGVTLAGALVATATAALYLTGAPEAVVPASTGAALLAVGVMLRR